jgi:4-hydroxy-tetrahydrodipicolinate reductase
MEKTKIFVVGSGKLANAILSSNLIFQDGELLKWEPGFHTSVEKGIIIHAGSGRELKECIVYCERTKSVFVELSTGLETEKMKASFPLVVCPNTSILLLKTLNMIKANGHYFENYDISITESHQAAKTTEPGTAYAFANALQFPLDKIVSVRDPEIQETEIGIPEEYLGKHAYHKIVIKDGSDQISIETKVLGHDSYAKGVEVIIAALLINKLENKSYTIFDLIDNNLL